MIVYLEQKSRFVEDVDSNRIEERILDGFKLAHKRTVGTSEIASWKNSMAFMQRIVADDGIPDTAGVAIEFSLPQSSKRIDFILTGNDAESRPSAVIIELKQWSVAETTGKDAIVKTLLGGARIETPHPSFQAWSYAALLTDFSETVRDQKMSLNPCAYLHNCADGATINHPFYAAHTAKAPAFLRDDAAKLRAFIKQHVKHGDSGKILYQIRDGKISPSKNLADCLASLLQGNREFLMIDDQKLVFETALSLARGCKNSGKEVLIVEGGPGTGKSVVAINLLVELTKLKCLVKYVTKNAAPRAVYENKLTGLYTKSRISNLFTGSGAYTDTPGNTFDALIVDEAHRLNEKSGMFQNLGVNQIKELIESAKLSVFFIDENQRVTLKDIGRKEDIRLWAAKCGASVTVLALESQFRCNGSNGYLAWVDNTLGIRPTANPTMEGIDYQFAVCSSPAELRSRIVEKNSIRNKARMVAGYCWDWASKKNRTAADIEFPGQGFSAKWNLSADGGLWIMKPESVSEIGCIHTCQGLELDYVGVLIGPDFIVRNGTIQTDAAKRSKMDASIKGYKKLAKHDPQQARERAAEIIKNTYRTLMTRGQKGCFVYSVDAETNRYLMEAAQGGRKEVAVSSDPYASLPLRLVPESEVKPYVNAVPVFNLQIAAGQFSEEQWSEPNQWVELPESFVAKKGFFVTRVVGESMNRRIPNGSWCLFKAAPEGSRQGKVVLVQLRAAQDPETGSKYTIKVYQSSKTATEDSWVHSRITLKPDSIMPGFSDMVLSGSDAVEFTIRGELVAVLGQI